MIVADTGAILALIDADDAHHDTIASLFDQEGRSWVLPWAVLPEVDYLLLQHVGPDAERAFGEDLARGSFAVEWGGEADLARARELSDSHRALRLGLVDAAVIAVAERVRAKAIVTLDVRHFGAIEIRGAPRLLPRDL